jgi:hypothetical protein
MAVLEGDPKREGIFTIRLKFPSNYRIKPHWHPAVERATIISGTLYFGHGEKVEKVVAGKSYDAETGSFSLMPERKVHYAWTGPSGAVIQVTGVGPWTVNYVDPADDPRNQGKNQ